MKINNSIDIQVIIDQNIVEYGSYNLPYGGEQINWEMRENHLVTKFEINGENLAMSSSMGGRYYKRDLTFLLNLKRRGLLLNGKVCANRHPEDPNGWHCANYHDVSLFSW